MIGIVCMCFVNPRGDLVGSPRVGVSKVERRGTGGYLLDVRPSAAATVRISALPPGYQARWSVVDRGMKVEVFDQRGYPADHGFALVIEALEAPPTPRRLGGPETHSHATEK